MLEHNNVASVLDCGVCLNVVLTPQSFHIGLVRRSLLGPSLPAPGYHQVVGTAYVALPAAGVNQLESASC